MSNPTLASQPPYHRARPGAPALLAACAAALLIGTATPALAQSSAAAGAAAPSAASAFDTGDIDLWRAAYLRVARLADEGDAEAARLALRMRHAAAKVFGSALQASPAQLRRWATVVANDAWANCDAPSADTLQLLRG